MIIKRIDSVNNNTEEWKQNVNIPQKETKGGEKCIAQVSSSEIAN